MSEDNNLDVPPSPDAGLFGFDPDIEACDLVVIGVPWEPTASYGRGTSAGPAAVVKASHQLDLFDLTHGGSFGERVGMLPINPAWQAANQRCIALADEIIEAGGRVDGNLVDALEEVNQASALLNDELYELVNKHLARGQRVAVLGGDHSAPLGSLVAHTKRYPGLGVLHFDAHADLRNAYEGFTFSHASIMYNLVTRCPDLGGLVSVGIRDFSEWEHDFARDHDRVTTFYQRRLEERLFRGESWAAVCDDIIGRLPEKVYVSFDIDGLDPTYCPNTGTPVPGGLRFAEAVFLLEAVAASGRDIVGFDLCEVAPDPHRPGDEWDANVGARLLHKLAVLTCKNGGK